MKRMAWNQQVSDAASSHRQSIEIDMYRGDVLFKNTTNGPLYLYVNDESDKPQSYQLEKFFENYTIDRLSLVFDHKFDHTRISPSIEEYQNFWERVKSSLKRLRLVFVTRSSGGNNPVLDIRTTNLYQALQGFSHLQELEQLEIVYDDDNIDKWIPKIFTSITNVYFSRTTNAYPNIIEKARNILYYAVDNVNIGDSTHEGKTQVSFYGCRTIHIVNDLNVTYEILIKLNENKAVESVNIENHYGKQLVNSKIKIFIPQKIKSQDGLSGYHSRFTEFFKNITYIFKIDKYSAEKKKEGIRNYATQNSVEIEDTEALYAFAFKGGHFVSLKDFVSRKISHMEFQQNKRARLKRDSASANKQVKQQKQEDLRIVSLPEFPVFDRMDTSSLTQDPSEPDYDVIRTQYEGWLNTDSSSSGSFPRRAREEFPLPPILFTGDSQDSGNEPVALPSSPFHRLVEQIFGNQPAASPSSQSPDYGNQPAASSSWYDENGFGEEFYTDTPPSRPLSPAGQVTRGGFPASSGSPKPMSFEADEFLQDSTYRTPGVPGEFVSRQVDPVSDEDGGGFFQSMMDKIAGHSEHNS